MREREREKERERGRGRGREREGIKSHPLEPIILSGQSFFFRKRADVSFRTGFFFNEIDPKWGKSRVEINQDETDKRSFFATKKLCHCKMPIQ